MRVGRLGLDAVKSFPTDRLSGLGTIGALRAPFGNMRFVPSGGISLENAAEYRADPAVAS